MQTAYKQLIPLAKCRENSHALRVKLVSGVAVVEITKRRATIGLGIDTLLANFLDFIYLFKHNRNRAYATYMPAKSITMHM